ncbi:PREDICTED: HAUS augmin-like complex subunit 7 isoform X1 [Miniopterus natalensis]|uniref:HAUS augmin-like complex subunit 7 isoform X1 n=1 Tax=Miniopterus natalensis TaxID=291302 RepID=UPI0007A70A82|nr:PREDICTED: HAUS augmin-like complex subunit 7 isoform X1 [Miniopterus natalensis]
MAELGAGEGCCGKEDKRDESLSKMAVEVFAKLKGLRCPFIKGLHIKDPKTLQEVLCRSSKYRLEILEWMYSRACYSWKDLFSSLKGAPVEVKIQVMVKLSRELMLCGPIEEILRGQASTQEQMRFIDQLLDAIRSLTIGRSSCSSVEEQFEDTREKNEELLGDLYSSSQLRTLLSPKCDPSSLDVQPPNKQGDGKQGDGKQSDGKQGDGKQGDNCQRAKPSVVELKEEKNVLELAKQLQESVDRMQALRAEHKKAVAAGRADTSILDQKLRLVISDFHQLVLAFLQVYDEELSECCQRSGPYLHPCGPIVEAVYQTLTSCRQLLKAVVQVTDTSASAVEMVEQQQGEQNYWSSDNIAMSLANKMEELIQKYKLLSESLNKRSK